MRLLLWRSVRVLFSANKFQDCALRGIYFPIICAVFCARSLFSAIAGCKNQMAMRGFLRLLVHRFTVQPVLGYTCVLPPLVVSRRSEISDIIYCGRFFVSM